MPPPRAPAIRLRLRNTLLAQKNGHGKRKPGSFSQQPRVGGSSCRQQRQPWQKMWVSTNKVLIGSVGGLKKTHFRNPNFECDETKLLISLWGDPQVQRTLITTHKKHPVIAKLAERMREYGYNRSTEEINTRIKNLKCFYNRIKKDLETGVINEASWKHYQAMDDILTRPVFGIGNAAGTSGLMSHRVRRPSGGSTGPDLSDADDQIEVKLELVSDDDKELRAEDLLKNAEQVELKEPNLLIPKDEPMEEDEDDPNDPDFEHDGGSETDDESSGMDEADESERSTRLRRRTKRVHKSVKSHPPTSAASTSAGEKRQPVTPASTVPTTAPSLPGTIKIVNYPGGPYFKFSSVTGVSSVVSTSGITTLAGSSGAATTTSTSSKISLVPTNFLLKPQTTNIGFKQPIQLYTKPTVSIAGSKPTPGLQPVVSVGGTTVAATTSGTAGAPMKLFLVNTRPKDGSAPKQQLITSSAAKHIYTTSAGVPLQKVTGLPAITMQSNHRLAKPESTVPAGNQPLPSTAGTPRTSATSGGAPKLGGFKHLLGQLVGLQRESLGITKMRVVAEKERFSNEKSVASSLLEALGELNALLTDANAELQGEPKTSEQMHLQISNVRHDPTLHRLHGRKKEARHVLQPVIDDDDNVKTEVIIDSE